MWRGFLWGRTCGCRRLLGGRLRGVRWKGGGDMLGG